MEDNKKKLEKILAEYKDMSNQELAEHIMGLDEAFNQTKAGAVVLAEMMEEISEVYTTLYHELNSRIKFNESED